MTGVNNFYIFNVKILFSIFQITNHYCIWMTFNFWDQIELNGFPKTLASFVGGFAIIWLALGHFAIIWLAFGGFWLVLYFSIILLF